MRCDVLRGVTMCYVVCCVDVRVAVPCHVMLCRVMCYWVVLCCVVLCCE